MSTSESPFPPIAVGCAGLPPGMSRATYFRSLPLLEMRLPGDEVPASRIAERWAAEARGGRHALVAPRGLSQPHRPRPGEADRELVDAVSRLADTARAANAAAVVFATPPDLSPSSAHRDALRLFFTDIASAERFTAAGGSPIARVWQPDGLWRPFVAAAFAEELGIAAVFDPLAPDPLEDGLPDSPTDVAYVRVTGLGRPSRPLGPDDLEELIEWATPSRAAFIVFATPTRFKDAVALARSFG